MSAATTARTGLSPRWGARIIGLGEWARSGHVHRILLAALSAALYLPGLNQNGWANAYYAAAVQAASRSWTSFWFASADMGNFVSVDKPPLSIWVMALSCRIFGFNTWSMLIPQALMGSCTVLLVYAICRSFLPSIYALFGGVAVATMPVATLMFRYNNPDALLVLLMTVCAWASLRILHKPRFAWSLTIGAAVGLGFMTKQLQILLIVPAVALCVLGAGGITWTTKARIGAVAAGAAIATGLTWFVGVSLVPIDARPFVGGSRTNSVWELTLGYNGVDRLTGQDASSVSGPATGDDGPAIGFIRLIYPNYAGQVSWLLPLVIVATTLLIVIVLRGKAHSLPAPVMFSVIWWWTSVPVIAYMGGIVHPYYLLVIAPPTAILGAWVLHMGLCRDARPWTRRALASGILVVLLLNLIIVGLYTHGFELLLGPIVVAGAMVSAALLIAKNPPPRISRIGSGLVVLTLLAGPAVWSVATSLSGHIGSSPSAGPASIIGASDSPTRLGFPSSMTPANESAILGIEPNPDLANVIRSTTSSRGVVTAAVGGQNAALTALTTGDPVVPVGGFYGADPVPTLTDFKQLVGERRIGGLVLGPLPSGVQGGAESQRIVDWVEQHYTPAIYGSLTYYSFSEMQ
ncbi:ArnT family glycosyltransferase [Sinomonas sp.]|uniref:ArnT family glycosyltransferase n=1 Tax=Sinomonas sp. TaxID=1914986 RepID=UPI003F813FC4